MGRGASLAMLADCRRALADHLRAQRAIHSDAIHAAFCSVSRHLFVPTAYRDNGATAIAYPISEHDDAAVRLVYRDRTLVTDVDAVGRPVSSSTAPSVMAFMLEALALRPGLRVLEIGCGTGYNAALIHAVTGAEVVSVDPRRTVVSRARRALHRHGMHAVTCLVADGYDGAPVGAPFDRIIATCAVAGISPQWLRQCAPGWRMVVPLAHGGIDMLAVVEPWAEAPKVRPIGGAGYFVHADGPLCPRPGLTWPGFGRLHLVVAAPVPDFRHGYHDLWFMAAVEDGRVGPVYGAGVDGRLGRCGLGDRHGAAALQVDGHIRAGGSSGPKLASAATVLLRHWVEAGRPRAREWRAVLRAEDRLALPLYVPHGWCRSPHSSTTM